MESDLSSFLDQIESRDKLELVICKKNILKLYITTQDDILEVTRT